MDAAAELDDIIKRAADGDPAVGPRMLELMVELDVKDADGYLQSRMRALGLDPDTFSDADVNRLLGSLIGSRP
jgi:hypothetical protein